MRDSYRYGEMLLILREEYKKCADLFLELDKYINIDDKIKEKFFYGILANSYSDREIRLSVEKKYDIISKMIAQLVHGCYSRDKYMASLITNKEKDGLYGFLRDEAFSPFEKYMPKVEITDQEKFAGLVDQIFATDLMNLKEGHFINENDSVVLTCKSAFIFTPRGNHTSIAWYSRNPNYFNYAVHKWDDPKLIRHILESDMPADNIPEEWLKVFLKYENILDKDLVFEVEMNQIAKTGSLHLLGSVMSKNGKCKRYRLTK